MNWGMGWVVVGTAVFWGAPILHLLVEKCYIFRVLAKNRGAPKNGRSYRHPSHLPVDAL